MKQLLLSAYAAHIKVSPQIHDIKESMLHNNLGHRLPEENTSSLFKRMEQPMKHKPPQLGLEQRSFVKAAEDLHRCHRTPPSCSPEAIPEAVP